MTTVVSKNVTLMSAGDMSLTSITSDPLDLESYKMACIRCVFTGAPDGTIKVTVSDGSGYSDLTGSSVVIAAAGDLVYSMPEASFASAKVVFTKVGGSTGAMTVTAFPKELVRV